MAVGDGRGIAPMGEKSACWIRNPDHAQAAAAMPAGRSPQWQALPAAVLQELLITRIWDLTDDDDVVRVVHHDTEAAVRSAQAAGRTAVPCNPMPPAEVHALAPRGAK